MAFFKCLKCKKIWQYPIAKCPECFEPLQKLKGKKRKITTISRVNALSVFHPNPYYVLVLEDEFGNKWVEKTTQEFQVGDEFEYKKAQTKDAVAIVRIKYDIFEAIENIAGLLGNLNIDSQSKILILPTLISPTHPYFSDNTSPQFLQAMIDYLIEKGARIENITVAGQSLDEIPIEASARKSELLRVCLKKGLTPVDLAKTEFIKKENMEISKLALESSLIINLPILKIAKTSATDNIFKLLKKENYLSLKYLLAEEEVISLLVKNFKNIFTLAEAQAVQKPDKFISQLNLALGSFNFIYIDKVFDEIIMKNSLPEYWKKINISEIEIVGRQLEDVKYYAEKY